MTDLSETRGALLQSNLDLYARLLPPQLLAHLAETPDRDRLSGSLGAGDLNFARDGVALYQPNAVVAAAQAVEAWRSDHPTVCARAPDRPAP